MKWPQALSGGAVVSAESYAEMTTPRALNDGSVLEYGFGLGVGELEGHPRISHGGGINGFVTMLAQYPDDEVIVTVLTNSGDAHPGQLANDLARLALGLPAPEIADLELTPDDTARYVGTYGFPRIRVEVLTRDGQLFLDTPDGETRLKYQGEHDFVAEFDAHVRARFMVEDETADAIVISPGGRLRRIQDQRP